MANQNMPEDPYRFGRDIGDYDRPRFDRDGPLDRDIDPGAPSGGKVTLFAIGIAIVLGAIFYAFNTTSLKNTPETTPTQRAQSEPISPRAPPGMTTGTAPAQPSVPPATAPANMSRNPPDNK
jgi:hypothetical protein